MLKINLKSIKPSFVFEVIVKVFAFSISFLYIQGFINSVEPTMPLIHLISLLSAGLGLFLLPIIPPFLLKYPFVKVFTLILNLLAFITVVFFMIGDIL